MQDARRRLAEAAEILEAFRGGCEAPSRDVPAELDEALARCQILEEENRSLREAAELRARLDAESR